MPAKIPSPQNPQTLQNNRLTKEIIKISNFDNHASRRNQVTLPFSMMYTSSDGNHITFMPIYPGNAEYLHMPPGNTPMHQHDYFEITYVFKGHCTINFEKSSVQMSEGNVCIIAPNTLHEPFVLDPDSFVINLSMTAEAFQSALSNVLLRRDLVSFYVQRLLYQTDMPNYLLILSNNSENIKNAVKLDFLENLFNNGGDILT